LINAVERAQRAIPDGRWAMFLRNHDQTRTMTEFQGDVARNKLAVSLLLTLPGLPFVYYGEEIGMTGSKQDGDPRLRTPMHWTRTRAAGFTTGTPWEPLPADSFTANVQALASDPNSLLNLHRRLIHLRASIPALGAGEFVALNTVPNALAFLRHSGQSVAVVVANLSSQPLTQVNVAWDASLAPTGRLSATTLLGTRRRLPLSMRADRRSEYMLTIPTLGAFETQIIQLTRTTQ
jgi:glycosidase